jgi:asparagine synthase (glutamine-hydrolysing)
MCGIAGLVDFAVPASDAVLGRMLRPILHRGPDDEGRFVQGPVAMGMRRLSIIDLSTGNQPMHNEDGTVTVVFNGEIFNYVELRDRLLQRGHRFATHSDTEVLVHLYEEHGTDMLRHLNGMFGFSIWDHKRQRLFVARDRLGVKPIYYVPLAHGVAYASELKSLLAADLKPRTLAASALFDYLCYQYLPGEQTPFEGFKKLLPGHFLLCDAQGVKIERWWDLRDHVTPTTLSRDEAREQLRELFLDSVRLRMRSDVPVGAYLSGGLDSSLVTGAAVRQTDLKFSTFNVSFAHGAFDESGYARQMASLAGTDHHELRVTPDDALDRLPHLVWLLDEPLGDSAILPTFLVSELAARHVKVALSGLGADELFGGYHRYHRVLGKFERLAALPSWSLQLLRPVLGRARLDWREKLDQMLEPPPPWLLHLAKTHRFDESSVRRLLGGANGAEAGAFARQAYERYPGDDFVNHRMFVDAHTYLPDQILTVTDRMSMGASLEARTPFLDYRLFEFASSIPGAWKVNGSEWKLILKEALGDLVPQSILTRPKWGFSAPVANWFGTEQMGAFRKLCSNSRLAEAGVIDGGVLRGLLADPALATHHAEWLWSFGVLELWYRIYGDGGGAEAPGFGLRDLAA